MDTDPIAVELCTKPGVPNKNNRIYSEAVCREAVRQLNERVVPVAWLRDTECGDVEAEKILGGTIPGSAEFKGNRVHFSVQFKAEDAAKMLRTGRAVLGGSYTAKLLEPAQFGGPHIVSERDLHLVAVSLIPAEDAAS